MKSINVKLENKNTDVIIDYLHDFSDIDLNVRNSLLVTDETMVNSSASQDLIASGVNSVVLGSGEKYKNLSSIEDIAAAAVENRLDRDGLFIGIGGGVICDMTAFGASVYMRGCRVILVPTSLLSMVDASIGGKTGVDFLERKNLIGSFYPAEKVLVYTKFLETLSDIEFKSGLAEIIKHGLLSGEELFEYMENNSQKILKRDPDLLEELIHRSLLVKADYIEKDFRENGCRAHLNLGHTFGHALETAAGLGRFTHGEAVAWGMSRALRAGVLCGQTDEVYAERAENLLRSYGYDIDFSEFDRELYMDAISSDKKKKDGKLRFVLQKNIGVTIIMGLDAELIVEVL